MPHFPTEWLRRTWDKLVQRILRRGGEVATALPVIASTPELHPDDPGEIAALFRPAEGGRARLTVEVFDTEPRIGGHVRLRLRLRNLGQEDLPFGSLTLFWWTGQGRDTPPIARQPALALPSTPPGGTAAFETRLPVPAQDETIVTILMEPTGGDGEPWVAEGPLLVLERQILAAVAAA